MIDPDNITNFHQTKEELQEFILFWVLVAGKSAHTMKYCLENLLSHYEGEVRKPFETITKQGKRLASTLKRFGVGCYNHKAKSMLELAHSGLDLKTCTVDDLTALHGIGPKTARCFIIHSRANQHLAGLDRHVMNYLRSNPQFIEVIKSFGVEEIPDTPPASEKVYKKIEQAVVCIYTQLGMTAAEFDLGAWKSLRRAGADGKIKT